MREDRDVARDEKLEERFVEPRRRNVMRRFDEQISGISERRQAPIAQAANHVGCDVNICADSQVQGDAIIIQMGLQALHLHPDLRAGIMIKSRQDMGCAGDNLDPVGNQCPCHFE